MNRRDSTVIAAAASVIAAFAGVILVAPATNASYDTSGYGTIKIQIADASAWPQDDQSPDHPEHPVHPTHPDHPEATPPGQVKVGSSTATPAQPTSSASASAEPSASATASPSTVAPSPVQSDAPSQTISPSEGSEVHE